MDINTGNINQLKGAAVGSSKIGSQKLRKPIETSEDLVTFSKGEDEGKLHLIISAQQKADLSSVKGAFNKDAVKDDLPVINAFTAEVGKNELLSFLTSKPDGVKVYLDEKTKMIDPIIPRKTDDATIKTDTAVKTLGVDKLWDKGFTGKDVTIAVLDTGICPHKDFGDRLIGFKDFVNGFKQPYDDQGHGTHVAGDCAGDGAMSNGKYKGTAPDAKLVGVKTLDKHGAGRFSDIIKGIMWTIENKDEYNIKVMNMSLGGPAFQSYKDDPICQAVEKAMDAGIMPVIAAGNSGPKATTVGSPGNDPHVLTVGAFDDKGTESRYDDEIAEFSSRGPTKIDNLAKPDLLSSGVMITAPTAYGSVLDQHPSVPHAGPDYITISGTSMATPIMAGIVADVIQARPDLSPRELKNVFTSTAKRLPGLDENQQGNGIVQPVDALDQAMELKGS